MTTLFLVLKKIESEDKTKYVTFYLNSKAEIIINESEIDDVFQSIYTTIISNIQKYLGKGSSWIIDLVVDHNISIPKYNPLAGSAYIKLPKKINHQRKGLVNVQNIDDNECFKWTITKYLNPANYHPAKLTKTDKDFAEKLDFKDMKFSVKIKTFTKLKKRIPLVLMFLAMKIKKNIQSMYQKNVVKKNIMIYY